MKRPPKTEEEKKDIRDRVLNNLPEGSTAGVEDDWIWVVPPVEHRAILEKYAYLGFQLSFKGRSGELLGVEGKASLYHRGLFVPEDCVLCKPEPEPEPESPDQTQCIDWDIINKHLEEL
tara:strand:- start:68 stop:424 length:357 start_codon:yes stop_codon:yes gene_type:complete